MPNCSILQASGLVVAMFTLLQLASPRAACSIENPENITKDVAVTEHLDQPLDLGLAFEDAAQGRVTLRDLILPGRPALIVPVYFGCPRLCGLTLTGLVGLIDKLDLEPGKDYTVITYSFDHTEDRSFAESRRNEYLAKLKDPSRAKDDWHFLTTDEPAVLKLSGQLGFRFMEEGGQFSHSAVMMVLTPEGKISRYFYGVNHDPRKVRFALVEASKGRIGSAFDKAFLYCFKYDHIQGRYTPIIWRIIQLAGSVGAFLTFLLILTLYLREKRADV